MKTIKLTDKKGLTNTFEFEEMPTITVDGEVVIFENKKSEFKRGDVLTTVPGFGHGQKCIFILKSKSKAGYKEIVGLVASGKLTSSDVNIFTSDEVRLATESEKQLLFDALAKQNKKFNFKTMQIEELKYIPQVGDCVTTGYFDFKCNGFDKDNLPTTGNVFIQDGIITNNPDLSLGFKSDTFKQLTPDQLQAKYEALGYKYIFENDTVEKLRWMPKENEECFEIQLLACQFITVEIKFANYYKLFSFNKGFIHQTESECLAKIEQIKAVLK